MRTRKSRGRRRARRDGDTTRKTRTAAQFPPLLHTNDVGQVPPLGRREGKSKGQNEDDQEKKRLSHIHSVAFAIIIQRKFPPLNPLPSGGERRDTFRYRRTMPLAQEISSFLRAHKLHLSRDLGQHFLIDERVLNASIDAADLHPQDHVIEIGAGIGTLTRELLKRTTHVTAIEADRRLIPLMKEFLVQCVALRPLDYARDDTFTIVGVNALRFPYPETPYKIVANLPYQITSHFLRTVFRGTSHPPTSLTLLIQKEVAEKIMGKPERSLLTLLVHLYGIPRIIRIVAPGAFLPPPKVESALIHIDCFPLPLADPASLDRLFELATIAFRKKRKMLRSSLGKSTRIAAALAAAGIDPTRRPETLTTEEWIRLAKEVPSPIGRGLG